jgi:hypothetical protein
VATRGAALVNRLADRVALGWARLYTRGLPSDVVNRRLDEIVSDLHEHATSAGVSWAQQGDVLRRMLWGAPADLSWRRATRAARPRPASTRRLTAAHTASTVIGSIAVAFNVFAGVGVWIGAGADAGTEAGGPRYGLSLLVGAALIACGLACRGSSPRASTVAIVVGAAAPMVVLYWMAPLFVPVWLLLTALSIAAIVRPRAAGSC